MPIDVNSISIEAIRSASFSEMAIAVARASTTHSSVLREFLVSNLLTLGRADAFENNMKETPTLFKLCLGLGILTAAQKSNDSQMAMCETTFAYLVFGQEKQLDWRARLLLLTELCYMDQFVSGETRQSINDRFSAELRKNAWSPAIKDYLHAWSGLERSKRFEEIKLTTRLDSPQLILVMSAKGGTGKSITAAAIAKFLMNNGKTVGLLDLDDSGPTAQYLFDVREVSDAIREIPPSATPSACRWCYPTFLDVLTLTRTDPNRTEAEVIETANRAIVECRDEPRLLLMLLPESPTFCAEIANAWGQGEYSEIIEAVSASVQAMSRRGCGYVVVDFAPGLFGTNGAIIKWASATYRASPILLSSSRASDIATSIYEAPWLAAKYEFKWHTPLLHLINRWHYEQPCVEKIVDWANRATEAALDMEIGQGREVSSATEIHSKRFWPIMYQVALDDDGRNDVAVFDKTQVLTQLPEDEELRFISSLHSDPEENLDFFVVSDRLVNTGWYRALAEHLREHLALGGDLNAG
jgi:hypothetical protein